MHYYSITLLELTKLTVCVNLFLIIIGVLVNILVVLVFSRIELRKLSVSIHTISLAVSDMFLLLIPVMANLSYSYYQDMAIFKTVLWCKMHGYIDMVFCCWSAWNVVALSSERWMAICKPSRVYLQNTKTHAIFIVIIIPIFSLLAFLWYPFIFEMKQNDYLNNKTYQNTTLIKLGSNNYFMMCKPNGKLLLLFFGIISIIITYIVPFLLITYFNKKIIQTLRDRIRKRKEYFGK
jgi:hypothetical protein